MTEEIWMAERLERLASLLRSGEWELAHWRARAEAEPMVVTARAIDDPLNHETLLVWKELEIGIRRR